MDGMSGFVVVVTPNFGPQGESFLIVDTVVQGLVSRIFVFIYLNRSLWMKDTFLWDCGRIGFLDEMDGRI
jgi:hypothetical protein